MQPASPSSAASGSAPQAGSGPAAGSSAGGAGGAQPPGTAVTAAASNPFHALEMNSKNVIKMNGLVVASSLKQLGEPTALPALVAYIASQTNKDVDDIKASVKQVLRHGMQYGFIDRLNSKYFLTTAARRPKASGSASKTSVKSGRRKRKRGKSPGGDSTGSKKSRRKKSRKRR